MIDVTLGATLATLLPPVLESLANGTVSAVVADAYHKLKDYVRSQPALAMDVQQLEHTPHSHARAAALAENIDAQPTDVLDALRPLVDALRDALAQTGQPAITQITTVTATDHSYAAGRDLNIGNVPPRLS